MAGYVEGVDRGQATLFPDRLDDLVGADNPVRVVDAFVGALDLRELGFARAAPASTAGRAPARSAASGAGSTSTCSTPWKSGSLAGQS